MDGYGEIYVITSPSGKLYVGQTQCFLCNGAVNGTSKRWRQHISDSKNANGGRCRKLNNAITKYGHENFTVIPLLSTRVENLQYFEDLMMDEFDSLNKEKGYNLRRAGNAGKLSIETRTLMSINRRLKPCFQQPHKDETKKKISDSLIDRVERLDHLDNKLPKYIKFIDWKDRKGYAIVSHPKCKLKYFVSNKIDLESLFQTCSYYLMKLLS
jgi:group I intron endonuclease